MEKKFQTDLLDGIMKYDGRTNLSEYHFRPYDSVSSDVL